MDEFEKQNRELFEMVHNNPYRTGVKTTVGCVFSLQEAQEYAAAKSAEARKQKKSHAWENMAAAVIATLAVIGMTVAALI